MTFEPVNRLSCFAAIPANTIKTRSVVMISRYNDRKPRIVIIDDEAANISLLKRVLGGFITGPMDDCPGLISWGSLGASDGLRHWTDAAGSCVERTDP